MRGNGENCFWKQIFSQPQIQYQSSRFFQIKTREAGLLGNIIVEREYNGRQIILRNNCWLFENNSGQIQWELWWWCWFGDDEMMIKKDDDDVDDDVGDDVMLMQQTKKMMMVLVMT